MTLHRVADSRSSELDRELSRTKEVVSLKDLLRLTQRRSERVVTLTATGDVDIVTGPLLEEAVQRSLRQHPRRLLLDLRGIRFFSSHGVDLLESAAESAAEAGIEIEIRTSSCIDRVLDLVGPESLRLSCNRAGGPKQLCRPALRAPAGIRT